jgi:glycosyltransferase involved in cell wall biosynthesis
MPPTLSIVTPSFNQAPFIERTILSVLGQGIAGLDFFIADGGSTDATPDVLGRYRDRLRFVCEADAGQADAVNKGIGATTGDIIGWLNSDDIYFPGALAAVLAYFESHPHTQVVYGDACHIDEQDGILEPYYTEDWNYERLKEVCFLCQPAVFFRRDLTEKAGLLDRRLTYCMDYEYWLRLGALTPFARIPAVLAGSRMYAANKTLGSRLDVHREINDMLLSVLGDIPDRWLYAYAHAVVQAKGFSRGSAWQNLRYIRAMIAATLAASFCWKRRVPLRVMKAMTLWAAGFFRDSLKRRTIDEDRV